MNYEPSLHLVYINDNLVHYRQKKKSNLILQLLSYSWVPELLTFHPSLDVVGMDLLDLTGFAVEQEGSNLNQDHKFHLQSIARFDSLFGKSSE